MHSTIFMTCTSLKSRDWYKNRIVSPKSSKKPLVPGHPVVFGQNISYIRKYSTLKVLGVTLC